MIEYPPILNGYEIASHGHLALLYRNAHARRFKGTPSLEHPVKVISENCKMRNLASGSIAVGHSREQPVASMFREPVHFRNVRSLERGLSPKRLHRPVSHSITEYDKILHGMYIYIVCSPFPLQDDNKKAPVPGP